MTTRHSISAADELYAGKSFFAQYSPDGRRGLKLSTMLVGAFGAALAIVTGALVNGATGAQLPNNATITYTPATDGVSPLDSTSRPATTNTVQMADGSTPLVYQLDVPRAVSLTVTHGASIVACTLLVSGYDQYGQAMSELLTITATGTSKTAAGKKAFAYIKSYAFTSDGNATTNTANLQWANLFGLPFRISNKRQLVPFNNGIVDTGPTIAVADDTSPATNVTGDPRGTVGYTSAADGTKTFGYWIAAVDQTSQATTFGQTPV